MGDVYYDPLRDEVLVVEGIVPHFGVFLEHADPRSQRCILVWPEGLVYVGPLG